MGTNNKPRTGVDGSGKVGEGDLSYISRQFTEIDGSAKIGEVREDD
jgi:hypothetical protein